MDENKRLVISRRDGEAIVASFAGLRAQDGSYDGTSTGYDEIEGGEVLLPHDVQMVLRVKIKQSRVVLTVEAPESVKLMREELLPPDTSEEQAGGGQTFGGSEQSNDINRPTRRENVSRRLKSDGLKSDGLKSDGLKSDGRESVSYDLGPAGQEFALLR